MRGFGLAAGIVGTGARGALGVSGEFGSARGAGGGSGRAADVRVGSEERAATAGLKGMAHPFG